MHRLLALTGGMVLLEGLLFTALGPLLPHLRDQLGLSAAQTGLLASAYVVGAFVAAFPAAMSAARLGVKATAALGLAAVGTMNLAFGLAGAYPLLVLTQLAAGVGGGMIWVAAMAWLIEAMPPDRRGEVIGAASGLTAVGEIAGPIIGGVAATAGRAVTFGSVASGSLLLLVGVAMSGSAPTVAEPPHTFRSVVASSDVRAAAGLTAVPFFTLGALLVLGSLQLDRLGAGPATIAAVFIVAAGAAAAQGPLVGRWSDRRGRLRPIRIGLSAGIPILIALALTHNLIVASALLVLALATVRCSTGPSIARLSDTFDATGVGIVLTLLVALPVSAAGAAAGTAGGGLLLQAAGLPGAYVAVAAIQLAVLVGLRGQTDPGRTSWQNSST